jgi:hypothetical protein
MALAKTAMPPIVLATPVVPWSGIHRPHAEVATGPASPG